MMIELVISAQTPSVGLSVDAMTATTTHLLQEPAMVRLNFNFFYKVYNVVMLMFHYYHYR